MDKIKNMILKKLVPKALKVKFILICALILFIFVIIPSIVYLLTLDSGTYKEGDKSNVPFVVSEFVSNAKFGEDGIYFEEMLEDGTVKKITVEDMWKNLEKNKSNITNYLDNWQELEKLVNAEVITQFPKIGVTGDKLDGTIEFKRNKTDGTSVTLQYINIEVFNSYIENKNTNVVNYFTIDENGNFLIGVVDKTVETITTNDSELQINDYSDTLVEQDKKSDGKYEKIEYNVISKPFNYKNSIDKYTMPFQYLWSWLVTSNDKDFVLELADLVKDSQIVISIYDNITTTVNTDIDTYKKERRTDTYVKVQPSDNYGVTEYPSERYWVSEDSEHYNKNYPADYSTDDENYNVTHIITYENNTPVVDLTKADVWIVNYSKEYTYQESKVTDSENNSKELDDTDYEEDENSPITSDKNKDLLKCDKALSLKNDCEKYIQDLVDKYEVTQPPLVVNGITIPSAHTTVSVDVAYVRCNYFTHKINATHTTKTQKSSQQYVSGNVVNEPKVEKNQEKDNFVTILCKPKYYYTKKNMSKEVTSWLFEILQKNPDTVNMIDITKYLLYKATNIDYGITDYDFSVYVNNSFATVTNGIYGGSIQEKVWFALKNLGYSDIAAAGAMGNIHYESGTFNPNAIENGYTETTGGIGICQWSNNNRGLAGRNTNLRKYAESKGMTWQDEDIQVAFLIGELTKGGGADGFASYQLSTTISYYNSSLATPSEWQNAKNVDDATRAFCYIFERPGVPYASSSMQTRISLAQMYYNQYQGQLAPENIDTILTGENKNKMEQLIAEAKRIANNNIYQYSQSFRESQYYYDCSSFVSRLYTQYFGISRLDSGFAGKGTDNIKSNCTSVYTVVSMTKLQPGDILWRNGHVALYIGNNQIAHASSPTKGILIATFNSNKFTEAYRIIR